MSYVVPFLKVKSSRIVETNNSFCELVKYSYDEILNKDIHKVSYMLRSSFLYEQSHTCFPKSFFMFTKYFEPIEVTIEVNFSKSDEKIYLLNQVSNSSITTKMPLFEHLFEDDAFGMAVFAIPDIILLKANQTYLKFFDEPYHRKETTHGRRIYEFVSGWIGSPSEKIWEELLQSKKPYHISEYVYNHFERGVTYWSASLIPIFEDGVMKYVVEMTKDITSEVMQRKEFEQVAKMKEDFFSFMSHEFKTPLTVMSSTIQLIKLLYKDQLPEKVNMYINKLNQSTLQQLRLVNNLLDITRGESGYLKNNKKNSDIVSMTRVIVDSVNNFAVRKDITIHFITEITELHIAIDDEKYERILLNLLSNAIKFTPEGKSVYVILNCTNDKLLVSIKDEGVGIPKDKTDLIFNRFGQVESSLTRQGEGTGIGLYLVKILVEALNGAIEVESELEKGSIFTIQLPIERLQQDMNEFTGELLDNRLIQSMDIEFSNIYFDN